MKSSLPDIYYLDANAVDQILLGKILMLENPYVKIRSFLKIEELQKDLFIDQHPLPRVMVMELEFDTKHEVWDLLNLLESFAPMPTKVFVLTNSENAWDQIMALEYDAVVAFRRKPLDKSFARQILQHIP